MKIIKVIPIISIICIIYVHMSTYATEFISYDNIIKIEVYQSTQFSDEKDLKDSYEATNISEIRLLSHYIDAFDIVKDTVGVPSDVEYLYITVTQSDYTSSVYMIYPNIIYSSKDKIAKRIKKTEYSRLCEIINGLIQKKIHFNNEVTTEPSIWAKADVETAVNNNFVPKWNQIDYTGNISRIEVCQLIDNILRKDGMQISEIEEYKFEDTNDIAVRNLNSLGIVNGKTSQDFAPYDYITREEFAKILSRTYSYLYECNIPNDDLIYLDKDSISSYAIDDVKKVTHLGLMCGDENNEFKPQKAVTKEEVIVTLLRMSEQK